MTPTRSAFANLKDIALEARGRGLVGFTKLVTVSIREKAMYYLARVNLQLFKEFTITRMSDQTKTADEGIVC